VCQVRECCGCPWRRTRGGPEPWCFRWMETSGSLILREGHESKGGISALVVVKERRRAVRVTLRASMVLVCIEGGGQIIFDESNSNIPLNKLLLYLPAQFLHPCPI